MTIRRARPGEEAALARLAFASKAHWGYDAAFMERVRPALTPSAEYVANDPVYVVEDDAAQIVAFYGFRHRPDGLFLEDMWVDPARIGTGLGRRMWEHALGTAHAERYPSFLIEADPNAEGFYLRCGARRTGEMISPETGRVVPVLTVDVYDGDSAP